MQKAYYVAPEMEITKVRSEQSILTNSTFNTDRNQKPQDMGDVDF